jgi:hypothetical protein
MNTHTCDDCGNEFEGRYDSMQYCGNCAEMRAMRSLSDIEPPEGGWPRGSDMDRI